MKTHSPTTGRVETVVNGMEERIMKSVYAPGELLPGETSLQTEWGVSRSVIREAMKMLASRGYVSIHQGRGTFVSESSETPLREQLAITLQRGAKGESSWGDLLEVRHVLEVAVAQRAAQRAKKADLKAMREAIDNMRSHPALPQGYVDADLGFHRALAEATGNPLWIALLNSLNDLLRQYREEGFRGKASALRAADQHEQILNAVIAKDVDTAAIAMQEHLQRSQQDIKIKKQKRKKL
ncbi:MAG: FadR/GntR family transcriptional regulator [Abditibacteriaceae bacterium]